MHGPRRSIEVAVLAVSLDPVLALELIQGGLGGGGAVFSNDDVLVGIGVRDSCGDACTDRFQWEREPATKHGVYPAGDLDMKADQLDETTAVLPVPCPG